MEGGQAKNEGSLLDNVVILLCLVQNIAAFGKNFALAILSFCGLGPRLWALLRLQKVILESMNISPPCAWCSLSPSAIVKR